MNGEEIGSDAAEGCMWGVMEALPLKWQIGVALTVIVVWIVIGHPGLS